MTSTDDSFSLLSLCAISEYMPKALFSLTKRAARAKILRDYENGAKNEKLL